MSEANMDRLAMIVAIARNDIIGRGGTLPWSYPEDRAHYLDLTRGHALVMGRRTLEETPEPRKDCRNIVISKTLRGRAGIEVVATLDEAISTARETDSEPFVIGGVRLFQEALPRVTHIWLTEIPLAPEGDTRFQLDRKGFEVVSERHGSEGLVFVELCRSLTPEA